MNFIHNDGNLILFKTRSFSTYSFAPPFLLMVGPPIKLSFWNYQQLFNRSMSNCFHINTYFVFYGFLQGKNHTEQHVVSEVASQLCNSELVKNFHTSWTKQAGQFSWWALLEKSLGIHWIILAGCKEDVISDTWNRVRTEAQIRMAGRCERNQAQS